MAQLKKKAWSLMSEYVRRRDKGVCFTCGKREWNEELGENNLKVMQAGHYIHNRLDYDPMNINCQCQRCNHFLSGNLGIYAERLIKKYGKTAITKLRERASQEVPMRKDDYLAQIYLLQGKLKDL